MRNENKTTLLKREILFRLAKLAFEDNLVEEVNRIPAAMIPRDAKSYRCCTYKDRAIIKYRALSQLGFDLGDADRIEAWSLAEHARQIPLREKPEFPILTFIDDACKSCVRSNYFISNVCKNCVARPCIENCPKDAIEKDDFQANIDPSKCINCGICQKACPYHAIVYVPVPCEEACPVGALYKDSEGREHIDYSKCIYCGRCTKACPFSAIMGKSQIIDIIYRIKQKKNVVAMLAPSIIGQFDANMLQLGLAMKALGFSNVIEVALGADITTRKEAEEFMEKMEANEKMLGTSCCPAYVEAVKKHAPAFLPYVSDTKTPMSYTAQIVKEAMPDSITVFVGPCVAKKHEGYEDPSVDYVITFEELAALFEAKDVAPENIDFNNVQENDVFMMSSGSILGRGFPVSGGVAAAVKTICDSYGVEIKPVTINGFTRKNVKLLNVYAKGTPPGNLIEVMSCEGGCICGPGVIENENVASRRLKKFLNDTQKPTPNENEIC